MTAELPPPYVSKLPRRRTLTVEERAKYNEYGYVVCRKWFSPEEMTVLTDCVSADQNIESKQISVTDTDKNQTKLTLWWYFGDDTYGQFGRSSSLVQAVADLNGGTEPYHSHSKVLLKEPRSGGAWEW
eukprot:SAG31_NODE_606_length_13607_cov_17.509846_12_plen_128_part_00